RYYYYFFVTWIVNSFQVGKFEVVDHGLLALGVLSRVGLIAAAMVDHGVLNALVNILTIDEQNTIAQACQVLANLAEVHPPNNVKLRNVRPPLSLAPSCFLVD